MSDLLITGKDLQYRDFLTDEILSMDIVTVYGAGIMGRALKRCLEAEPYNKRIEAFIVNGRSDDSEEIGGTPVIALNEASDYKSDKIIVALNENNMKTALCDLETAGFRNIIPLNAAGDTWSYIKGNYYLYNEDRCYLPFVPIENCRSEGCSEEHGLCVYVVNSVHDKRLKAPMKLSAYERNIQVGATLTDSRICDITDESGDNISAKNAKFCELTALYWIWKNDESDYIGLSHYRRRFDLSDGCVDYIKHGNADIIVTIPVINTRGVGVQYCMTHSENDWETVKGIVIKSYPEYKDAFLCVEQQEYFHAYNMFIMRRGILDEYCQWLFPVLFESESVIGDKTDPYQNRYPGFLSERLLNVFMYKNRNRYRIRIARKRYLE